MLVWIWRRIILKISETTDIDIQSQHWGRNRQLLIEGVALECLPKK